MDTIVSARLAEIEIGDPQTHENMTVFPLFHKTTAGPDYLTLEEALGGDVGVSIEEVSEGGSVPDIKVVNKSPYAVLLLDGEEVAGAKQNRLINTSILIRTMSEVSIPVSCSESGRWFYRSRRFSSSGHVSPHYLRARKSRSVSDHLKQRKGYYSDQGMVWESISQMHGAAGTSSDTSAMKDMYDQKARDLDGYLDAFGCLPEQRGCAVCIGGEVVAVETMSRDDAYGKMHRKILESHAIEASWEKKRGDARPDHEAVESFLRGAKACSETRYESVGEGYDFRYHGNGFVGSALVVGDCVVHSTLFHLRGEDHRPESPPEEGRKRRGGDGKLRDLLRRLRRAAEDEDRDV
jgi:hypothetical protein